jgi:uncharacterized membrane protein
MFSFKVILPSIIGLFCLIGVIVAGYNINKIRNYNNSIQKTPVVMTQCKKRQLFIYCNYDIIFNFLPECKNASRITNSQLIDCYDDYCEYQHYVYYLCSNPSHFSLDSNTFTKSVSNWTIVMVFTLPGLVIMIAILLGLFIMNKYYNKYEEIKDDTHPLNNVRVFN